MTTHPSDIEKDAPISQGIRKAWRWLAALLNNIGNSLKTCLKERPFDPEEFRRAAEQAAASGLVVSTYTELVCLSLTSTGLGNATR